MNYHTSKVPEISVIVPVYKVEKYLSTCIESILNQSFSDFELLLIDDGSPDRCGAICERYASKDSRIKVFHQNNKGPSEARNVGLKKSIGNYISFIDSDDYVKVNYLKDLYDALPVENKHGGVVIEALEMIFPDNHVENIQIPNIYLMSDDFYLILTEFKYRHVGYIAGKLYDSRIIKKYNILFVSDVSIIEDFLFLLDYLLYAEFVSVLNISNYVYRCGYSQDALSVRISDFEKENNVFLHFKSRVLHYQKIYSLDEKSLYITWKSLTIFFHKMLLSIYLSPTPITFHERIRLLERIKSSNREWMSNCFIPKYVADKLGKRIWLYFGNVLFDSWMSLLFKFNFRYMFGSRNNH